MLPFRHSACFLENFNLQGIGVYVYSSTKYGTARVAGQNSPFEPLRTSIRYRNEDIVSVVVLYTEKSLRDKLKAAGGTWNPGKKLWQVPFGVIRGNAELEGRIVKD